MVCLRVMWWLHILVVPVTTGQSCYKRFLGGKWISHGNCGDQDIDECKMAKYACHANATCTNTIGSYECTCITGFTGNGKACRDIDECVIGTNACHRNAVCTNKVGSYECTCNIGFRGNGRSCTDIDECGESTADCDAKARATCINNVGSFICNCKPGYAGDGKTCTNINECTAGGNNCHSDATCADTTGSWTCECKTGFTGDGVTCYDADECRESTDNCDAMARATCINSVGSFICKCKPGYAGNGRTCTNINECTTGGHNCHSDATCTDTVGSWKCKCRTGYNGDGVTCVYSWPGWTVSGNRHYKCFNDRTATYQQAQRTCSGYGGGRLAAEVLRNPVAARDIASRCFNRDGEGPWVGFDDITAESHWRWSDGGTTNSFTTGWNSGEPNGGGNENCGHIWTFSGNKLLLNDHSCDHFLSFICEI